MPQPVPPTPVIRFGVFEVDLRSGELRKNGLRVKLQEQPFQVLAMLLEHPGVMVTREEIQQKLWPADTFVDFEHGLNAAINKLREALGDSADNPRFVETLHRRGYRFIYPVEAARRAVSDEEPLHRSVSTAAPEVVAAMFPSPVGGGDAAATVGAGPALSGMPAHGRPRGAPLRKRYIALAAGIVMATLAVLAAFNVAGLRDRITRRAAPTPPKIESIAVLPLENLSHDPEQEYFADGMTDELITSLGKISALRVISRTTAMHFKGSKKTLPEIARELNVDAVVEGSVLRSGNRVRISANLVQAPTDRHLWAESYERNLRDVLALQSDVARAIAGEIKIKIAPEQQARLARVHPVNPEGYEAYLRGRFYSNKRTPEGIRRSQEYFKQAIEKDPAYALAYSGLADSYALLGVFSVYRPNETGPKSKAAALKALELDENLAEAHTSLAFINCSYEWDWLGAEREFKRAIELNPGYATAHHWHAECLGIMGRREEGLAEAKRARDLDPLSSIINVGLGRFYCCVRQYDEAIHQYRRTLDLDPTFAHAHLWLGQTYLQKGMLKEAIGALEEADRLSGGNPRYLGALGYGYAVAGRKGEALATLARLKEQSKHRYVLPYNIAEVYVGLGEKDQAFDWLNKAFEERSMFVAYLNVEPLFDSLRSDPRFQDLLRRMKFPQ